MSRALFLPSRSAVLTTAMAAVIETADTKAAIMGDMPSDADLFQALSRAGFSATEIAINFDRAKKEARG